jgi:hypothetical protein
MALALPAADPAAPGSAAPVQALAGIDAKGVLKITYVCAGPYGAGGQEHVVPVPGGKDDEKAPAKVKVKVTTLMVMTAELDAKHVRAYGVDGKAIPADKLATLLAKEKTVLVSTDGKKVGPFRLQLFKDDTIVLVPPTNTLGGGMGWGNYILPYIEESVPPKPIPRDSPKREPSRDAVPRRPAAGGPAAGAAAPAAEEAAG